MGKLVVVALASTPPGMPGTHPANILVRGMTTGISPPILLHTYGYSRPILVALRSLSLKPISFGYKTPPIRFRQAGGQSETNETSCYVKKVGREVCHTQPNTMVKSTMTETCSAVLRSRRNCSSDGAERTDDGRASGINASSRLGDEPCEPTVRLPD